MNFPDTINVLGKNYKITYVDKPSDVDIFKRNSLWGQIDPWTRTIRLYKGNEFSKDEVFQSLIHEIIHAIVSELYIHPLINDDKTHKEEPIDLLALAFADILKRNKLVEFDDE